MRVVGILDLQLGNLRSVANAVYEQGYDFVIVTDAAQLDDLSHLILPGVGHFQTAMQHFTQSGLLESVQAYVASKRPLLGICLGMQLFAALGHEGCLTQGLDFIPGAIVPFNQENLRVPHIGWNTVRFQREHPVFAQVKKDRDFYFVHSYHYQGEADYIYATTDYGAAFPAIIGKENVIGFQFHPEKSQKNGLQLLENFCQWDGQC